jgi:hypothetical protein
VRQFLATSRRVVVAALQRAVRGPPRGACPASAFAPRRPRIRGHRACSSRTQPEHSPRNPRSRHVSSTLCAHAGPARAVRRPVPRTPAIRSPSPSVASHRSVARPAPLAAYKNRRSLPCASTLTPSSAIGASPTNSACRASPPPLERPNLPTGLPLNHQHHFLPWTRHHLTVGRLTAAAAAWRRRARSPEPPRPSTPARIEP